MTSAAHSLSICTDCAARRMPARQQSLVAALACAVCLLFVDVCTYKAAHSLLVCIDAARILWLVSKVVQSPHLLVPPEILLVAACTLKAAYVCPFTTGYAARSNAASPAEQCQMAWLLMSHATTRGLLSLHRGIQLRVTNGKRHMAKAI